MNHSIELLLLRRLGLNPSPAEPSPLPTPDVVPVGVDDGDDVDDDVIVGGDDDGGVPPTLVPVDGGSAVDPASVALGIFIAFMSAILVLIGNYLFTFYLQLSGFLEFPIRL